MLQTRISHMIRGVSESVGNLPCCVEHGEKVGDDVGRHARGLSLEQDIVEGQEETHHESEESKNYGAVSLVLIIGIA